MGADKGYKRRATDGGLGSGEHRTDAQPAVRTPETSERRSRTTLPAPPDPTPRAELGDPPRSERKSREAIVVDHVGKAAVELTWRPPLESRPKVVKSHQAVACAPLEPREAFVLSLIDGNTTVPSLVDVAGMSEREVTEILARLRRLGIIVFS